MGRMDTLEKQMIGLPQAVTSSLKSYFDGRDHGKLVVLYFVVIVCNSRLN
jgi:hypothetical protein